MSGQRKIAEVGVASFFIEEHADGSVTLLRTTKVDDGPPRSIVIPGSVLQAVVDEITLMTKPGRGQ